MIADFQQFYGLDLLDVFKFDGSLTPVRAALLIEKLPFESRYFAVVQGGSDFLGWTPTYHALVSLIEQQSWTNFILAQSNSKKKLKTPKSIARPGDKERKKEQNKGNLFSLTVQRTMTKMRNHDGKEA